MGDNRSQDIQVIKLAVQIEKDGIGFLDRFLERAGDRSKITAFLQGLRETSQSDLDSFQEVLGQLEASQGAAELGELSLEDYAKELYKTRTEKFYPNGRISEFLGGFYNPVRILGFYGGTLQELSRFYADTAGDIHYEREKQAFQQVAERKQLQSQEAFGKKNELISRFP